ncbi:ATP-binding protein [Pedosphaera parvula]|uniref:histidine kinase n=1 Tax=Pedosphaera parvula (strain Ellin514) TaxID=320771 RepID=B9XKL5_PEDPL|nr:ATP-binding protein [Pedosphaera parvula]EEF59685.1 multi-sensor signal transduction histidine kinase [Pedosphaera parvula Ellin514]
MTGSNTAFDFLSSGGEMARRIRDYDWSKHPLGPLERWPQSLKIAVRIMLTSRYQMWVGWGPEFYFFCNDAYLPTVGIKHTWVLGTPASKVWAEIWPDIGPRAESVVKTGNATWDEGLLLFLQRSGFTEETYHTFSYSPLPDDSGAIGGLLCVVTEETERTIDQRRLAMLREMAADLATVKTEGELFRTVEHRLKARALDIPFGLVYLYDAEGRRACLACSNGVTPQSPIAPAEISLSSADSIWPAQKVFETNHPVLVENLTERFQNLPTGPWNKPARQAVLVPITQPARQTPAGFLVAGINPYRPFGSAYSGFLDLLAGQIAAALSNARVYEAERQRAEALAEIDRAKTTFFSNVSHEFRTPLTLLLGPVEDLLNQAAGKLDADEQEELKTIHRNGLRLLKLVNSLLDFSRIEAGRIQAAYQEIDLAGYTAELASVFRSAIEKAGLKFTVDCPPLAEPIFVDRDMWEKIVLNLISNAFKFTLQGEIEVRLRQVGKNAELTVRDTGAGIPAEQVNRVFERFHRVEGTQGRTHEGTGIGLALVHELVKLHGGRVSVSSELGQGSTFTVSLPFGQDHLPQTQVSSGRQVAFTNLGPSPYVTEAARWLPDGEEGRLTDKNINTLSNLATTTETGSDPAEVPASPAARARILLADDNADMRDYVMRLLKGSYRVEAVADGEAALKAALKHPPDLILSDIMMPRLDGFGLLREVRNNPSTRLIPVILLSARAGEESRVEGLGHGADDYLTKPFSAHELLARVRSHLRMARLRQEAADVIQAREHELSLIYNNTSDVIFYIGVEPDQRFRFLSVNPSFLATTGLSENQVTGKLVNEVIPEPSCSMVLGHYKQAIQERKTIRWEETSNYPSGKKVGMVSITPIFNPDGVCINLIGTVHDITERKQIEEKLERLVVERTAKLRDTIGELEAFSYSISHDLRAPLRSMQGFAEVLKEDCRDQIGPEGQLYLNKISDSARRMDRLIQDVLTFSKMARTELILEPINTEKLLQTILDSYPSFQPPFSQIAIKARLPLVLGNEAALTQCISNLIGNAIKFVQPGTVPQISVWAEEQDGYVRLFFKDNGIGIPKISQERIFGIFQRISTGYEGTGIGLAIVKKAVERMGGKVGLYSEEGRGSTFWLELKQVKT